MAKVPHGVETLPKILIARVGCTNVTDEMTDRRTMTYSEREHMRPTVGWGVDTPPHTQSHSDRPTFVARHASPRVPAFYAMLESVHDLVALL